MIEIKKPIVEDAVGIQNVSYETWMATYPNKEIGVIKEDIEEKFKNRLSKEAIQKREFEILNPQNNNFFLVAKENNTVIGICKAEKDAHENRLTAIYVLPEHQGRDVGMLLWKCILDLLGSKKSILVDVASYNLQAINFYKRIGFIETGKRFVDEKYKMPISGIIIPEIEMILI